MIETANIDTIRRLHDRVAPRDEARTSFRVGDGYRSWELRTAFTLPRSVLQEMFQTGPA